METINDRSTAWKNIWTRKGLQTHIPLHHIDGFDLLPERSWEEMVAKVSRPIGIKKGDSILECGCGAGAFLKSLLRLYPGIRITGVDYSKTLLERAKNALPGTFLYGDISNLDFFQNNFFDHSLSFSAFHYLSSERHAKKVVREMVRVTKPGGAIYIGEVSDADKKAEAAKIRKASHKLQPRVLEMSPDHLYLSKDFFKRLAYDLEAGIKIVDHTDFNLGEYQAARYRYSVYLRKAENPS